MRSVTLVLLTQYEVIHEKYSLREGPSLHFCATYMEIPFLKYFRDFFFSAKLPGTSQSERFAGALLDNGEWGLWRSKSVNGLTPRNHIYLVFFKIFPVGGGEVFFYVRIALVFLASVLHTHVSSLTMTTTWKCCFSSQPFQNIKLSGERV
jgi:hypothetical protein